MSFWDTALAGVLIGGAITTATQFATQLLGNRREGRRELAAASAKVAAEWKSLQIQTLVDIQENLEQGASVVSSLLAEAAMSRWRRPKFPDMIPFARALMLCSRLQDTQLGADVRAWIVDVRVLLTGEDPLEADWSALRDRRIALEDRLGSAIREWHGR